VSVIDVGDVSLFALETPTQVRSNGHTFVVVRFDDAIYVLDDRCSHEDFSLSEGDVDVATREIECARHGAMFRLADGTPASLPATRPVAAYDVSIRDGRVEVHVP